MPSLRIVSALVLPLLLAAKCVEYDPRLVHPDAATIHRDAHLGDGFVPALACQAPDEAQLVVRDFAFNIQCGCKEAEGKTCTVPAGTTVVWKFADSEEHNVSSLMNAFGMSSDSLAGVFRHTFQGPGSFGYGCTIHPTAMSGYMIVVE